MSDPMTRVKNEMAALANTPDNELPEPFDQQYANLYLVLEDFLVNALEAGVDPAVLYRCVVTDIDQTIANHS